MLFLALLLVMGSDAIAQGLRVTGQVLSEDENAPIAGATVRVKGTDVVGITNNDGLFAFTGLKSSAKQLEVSFIGYEMQTVDISPDLKIYLKPTSEMMDEVIVVAFGKQKREAFTGSASVISAADITRQQVTNPLDALNGRVTGLQMTETNSFQSSPDIHIRGVSSLSAGTSPLIVVDGMPFNGSMNDINPADIENITVLKDAASNALYGARGANGVILISTKNAQKGNTKVNFDAKWGVNHDARVKYDYIDNPGEYYEAQYQLMRNYYQYRQAQSREQAHINANNMLAADKTQGGLGYMVYAVPDGQFLVGENGRINPAAVLGNRVAYDNTIYTLYPDDWTEAGTRNGFRQEYNVTLTGGNDQTGILAALGYLDNEGISYGTDIKRYSARLKAQYQAYKNFRVGANAGYTHTESNSHSGVFAMLYNVAPIYPLYIRDAEGKILTDLNGKRYDYGNYDCGAQRPVELGGNPIQDDRLNKYERSTNAFNMQGFGTLDITQDLHLTVNGTVYLTESRWNSTINPYYGYTQNTGGYTYVSHSRECDTNFQQLLNYGHSFGDHNVDVLLGHEYSRETYTQLNADRNKIAIYDVNTELNGAIVNGTMNSYKTLYNVEGYFMRAQYDYASRYFASASYRRDGSSCFHPDHRWGNFWSLGGAWILSKEEWFPKTPLVNMLKYKISYGEQGNDNIGYFRYTDMYYIRNSNDDVAYSFNTKGNPDITWETVGSFNTGIEFELFNSRLRGSLEYYNRTTRDMLMYFSAPYTIGYAGYYDNVGDMCNKGLEVELSADIFNSRNFAWTVNMNLSWQKNKVTYIPSDKKNATLDGYNGYVDGWNFIGEGLPIYTWRLKKNAGVNDEGRAMFYKTLADGTIATTTNNDEATYYECGTALPDVFGGFSTSLRLYGFDLSAQFNYSIGGKKVDYGYYDLMCNPCSVSFTTGKGIHRDVLDGWTPENSTSNIPMWAFNDDGGNIVSDRFLVDGSYLTFRNLMVGYTLPANITRAMKLSKVRIYGVCENVAYWTKRKGFDPRQSYLYGDYGNNMAPMRTISGGIQLQF